MRKSHRLGGLVRSAIYKAVTTSSHHLLNRCPRFAGKRSQNSIRGETKVQKQRIRFIAVAITAILVTAGCAPQQKKTVVVRKNQYYRCKPAASVEKKMVRLINRARAAGAKCGSQRFRPAAKIHWNTSLAKAARGHSKDMAARNKLGHKGSGRSTVEKRVVRAGYTWRAVGENVAGGLTSSEAVVSGWLQSPTHCANIMEPAFTEIGAACAHNPESRYGTYWTLVMAAPLK